MKRTFFVIIILIFIIGLYAIYVEPFNLKTNEYHIESDIIDKNFDGLKIVHFSDTLFTNESDLKILDNLVNKINEAKPDIVFFTGDLINKKISKKNQKTITEKLSEIKASQYKYFIMGNKDPKVTEEILTASGFIYLNNSCEYLFYQSNNPILIAGGNKLDKRVNNFNEKIKPSYTIALIHKPDDVDKILDKKYNLVLAGHSLGGQVRIPFYKAIIDFDGAKKYSSYKHEFDDTTMYISYGIGTLKYPVRLFDTPSINIYRIYKK